jgi:hypothetical protein
MFEPDDAEQTPMASLTRLDISAQRNRYLPRQSAQNGINRLLHLSK